MNETLDFLTALAEQWVRETIANPVEQVEDEE